MEVVREVLDKKLKGNDISLVDKILSYIDPDPENYVRFCSECNCLDKINYQNEKCDICSQKELVVAQFDKLMSLYHSINPYKIQGTQINGPKRKFHKYFLKLHYPQLYK